MRSTIWFVSAVLLLVGCGVPVQETSSPIAPEMIPSRLRSPEEPSPAPSTVAPGEPAVVVHFVRNDRLIGLAREAPGTTPTDTLNAVVEALLAGPDQSEQARGISSALPPGLELSVAEVQGQRVVLELSGDTGGRSATENVLAVGQIVLSVTSLPSVQEVTFQHDGVPVEALLADGALTTEPLRASDYATLRAR